MTERSLFSELGGEAVLRPIIHDFVERMVKDVMIGFFFHDVDHTRLEALEYRFTAGFLGEDLAYTGRPLREAHAKHRIMGGQFDRRKKILEETLVAHGVPARLREAWLLHVEELRPLITKDSAGECD